MDKFNGVPGDSFDSFVYSSGSEARYIFFIVLDLMEFAVLFNHIIFGMFIAICPIVIRGYVIDNCKLPSKDVAMQGPSVDRQVLSVIRRSLF